MIWNLKLAYIYQKVADPCYRAFENKVEVDQSKSLAFKCYLTQFGVYFLALLVGNSAIYSHPDAGP